MHIKQIEQVVEFPKLRDSHHQKKMQTDLVGRLRNLHLDPKNALWSLFEAVTNGFQSYPDSTKEKNVYVVIERGNLIFDQNEGDDIVSISVQDFGVGFDHDNLESFKKLDSTKKLKFGCKGVGRLIWLKVFERVEIQSVYEEEGKKYKRIFCFTAKNEIEEEGKTEADQSSQTGTTVVLKNRVDKFLKGKYGQKETIEKELISHFLLYLLEDGNDIVLQDGAEKCSLKKKIEQIKEKVEDGSPIEIEGEYFKLKQILFKGDLSSSRIAWCANKRVVLDDQNGLSSLPKISNSLKNFGNGCTYVCLVESDYLDDRVMSDRTGFQIPEKSEEPDLFELSMSTIRSRISASMRHFLRELIEKEDQASEWRKEKFAQENPAFKPVVDHFGKQVEISSKAEDAQIKKTYRDRSAAMQDQIDEQLKAVSAKLNRKAFNEVNKAINEMYNVIQSDVYKVINAAQLANYVIRRKAVLQCFEKALGLQKNGEYCKEDILHNLIVPMGCDSESMYFDEANLWVIDDRLSFHNYIASDIKLKQFKISELDAKDRPDIAALRLCDYSDPLIVGDSSKGVLEIVEFKRPMRDKIFGVFDQLIDYALKLTRSKIKSYKGRPVECIGPVFGYIITDISDEFERYLVSNREFNKADVGYFYKVHKAENFNLVVEVLSYDYLLKRAKQRNQVFFRKLGLE